MSGQRSGTRLRSLPDLGKDRTARATVSPTSGKRRPQRRHSSRGPTELVAQGPAQTRAGRAGDAQASAFDPPPVERPNLRPYVLAMSREAAPKDGKSSGGSG